MIDKKLKNELQRNADKILEIMEKNGFDVSRYKKISEDLKQKKEEQKERAKVNRKNYKTSTTAFLRAFAYADINAAKREKERADVLALKDCLLISDRQTDELQQFLDFAEGKKKTCDIKPLRLKSVENTPDIVETEKQEREEKSRRAKKMFLSYYFDNWFFLLLDIINKDNPFKYKEKHNEIIEQNKRLRAVNNSVK